MNHLRNKTYKMNLTWDRVSFLIYMVATLLILGQGILLSQGYISNTTSCKIIFPTLLCIILGNVLPVLKQDWRSALVYIHCVVIILICGAANFMF